MENRTFDDWINLAHKLNRYTKPLGLLYKLEMLDMDILVKILLDKLTPIEIEHIKHHIITHPSWFKESIDNDEPNVEKFLIWKIKIRSENVGRTKRKRKSKRTRK